MDGSNSIVCGGCEFVEVLGQAPRSILYKTTFNTKGRLTKPTERHRWLADGRLPSAGTRTVRLNGRARQITFHVFDPKAVEDILDRGIVEEWRVEDAEAKAEKREKAAYQRKLERLLKKPKSDKRANRVDENAAELRGWEEFNRDGFLR